MSMFLTFGRGFVSFISMGIPFLLAVTGAFGIQQSSNYSSEGAQMVFVGVYMVAFAAILFIFEVLQLVKIPYLDEMYRKNFGFMYGPIGRGLYTLLVGVFSFGLFEPRNLAIACAIVIGFWGCAIIILSCVVQDFFPPKKVLLE